jgi:hypothetical protein
MGAILARAAHLHGTAYNAGMFRLAVTAFACLCASALSLAATATPEAPAVAASATGSPAEPQVLKEVAEDEHVRIEELRVRGQTKRLTVQPKIKGMSAYEIVPPEPGRDPAQDPKAGKRVLFTIGF